MTLKPDPRYPPSTDTDSHTSSNARLAALKAAGGTAWVKLHLLHFNFGGPNEVWNLAPGTNDVNQQMVNGTQPVISEEHKLAGEAHAEMSLRSDKLGRKTLWYETLVQLHTDPADKDFAHRITVKWGEMAADGKSHGAVKKTASYTSPRPPAVGATTVSLSHDTATNITLLTGIDKAWTSAIQKARGNYPYTSVQDVIDHVKLERPRFKEDAALRVAIDAAIAAGKLTIS
jgi:hypothetical protein